jgi:hypothetical protein
VYRLLLALPGVNAPTNARIFLDRAQGHEHLCYLYQPGPVAGVAIRVLEGLARGVYPKDREEAY